MTLQYERDPVLQEVILLRPVRHADTRGWFSEVYNAGTFAEAGIAATFVQDNHSLSRRAGTLRGLHFQAPPHAQAKLVRCVRGRVLDVVVDIRHGSPTFGRYASAELDAASGTQIFIPEGFAHGFCTLEDDCEVIYKVNVAYHGPSDRGLAFDDPALAIAWPLPFDDLTLSDRDRAHPRLADLPAYFEAVAETAR